MHACTMAKQCSLLSAAPFPPGASLLPAVKSLGSQDRKVFILQEMGQARSKRDLKGEGGWSFLCIGNDMEL